MPLGRKRVFLYLSPKFDKFDKFIGAFHLVKRLYRLKRAPINNKDFRAIEISMAKIDSAYHLYRLEREEYYFKHHIEAFFAKFF